MIKDKLSYVAIWYCGRFVLPHGLFILVHPALQPVMNGRYHGLSGWRVENALSVQSTGEGLRIYGKPNDSDFLLLAPEGIVRDASYVKIRLRTMSIGTYVKCILMSKGKIMLSHTQELYTGRSWKEYIFDIRGAKVRENPIDFFAFTFKHNENIEIKDVTVNGPSFSEFFRPQGLKAFNVNLLYPFTVFGYNLNVVFLVLSLASGLCVAFYHRVKHKKGSLADVRHPSYLSVILDVREL
jgi:hypothetical protein